MIVSVPCLFLALPWVGLQCVIVTFSWPYSLYKSIVNDWHIFVISDKRRGPRCGLTGNKTVTIYFTDMRTIIEIPIEEI